MAWNFTSAAGLVCTANMTRNAVDGIMGYAITGPSPDTGSFYAVRQREAAADDTAAAVPGDHDFSKGPPKAAAAVPGDHDYSKGPPHE